MKSFGTTAEEEEEGESLDERLAEERPDRPTSDVQLAIEDEAAPDDDVANNDLGYHLADAGRNLDEAEKLYARALKLQRDNFDALHLLGVLNQQRGKPGEAYRLIASALKMSCVATPATRMQKRLRSMR